MQIHSKDERLKTKVTHGEFSFSLFFSPKAKDLISRLEFVNVLLNPDYSPADILSVFSFPLNAKGCIWGLFRRDTGAFPEWGDREARWAVRVTGAELWSCQRAKMQPQTSLKFLRLCPGPCLSVPFPSCPILLA